MRYLLLILVLGCSMLTRAQSINWAFNNGGSQFDGTPISRLHRDKSGNVYQCGSFSATMDVNPSAATNLLTSNGSSDGFIAKYNAAGNFIWAFNIGSSDLDVISDVATDSNKNVYITGSFRNTVDFDPSPTGTFNLTTNGQGGTDYGWGGDAFVAKYDSNGAFKWAFNIGGYYVHDIASSVSVSPGGTVYVSGSINMSSPVDFDPSAAVFNLFGTNGHAYLAKYTTNGQFVWAFNIGGSYQNSSLRCVELDDKNGNLFVAGYAKGTNYDMDPSSSGTYYLTGINEDPILAKYDTNMNFKFALNVPTNYIDEAYDIVLDSNNTYITGYVQGSGIDFDPSSSNNTNITTNGNNDLFVAKYSKAGQFKWAKTIGATGNEQGFGISVDGNNVYSTGKFENTVDFDPSPNINNLTSAGVADGYVLRQDTLGNFLCAFRFGSTSDDVGGNGVIGYGNNKLILTGAFQNSINLTPSGTPVMITSNGSSDLLLANYTWNACGSSDTVINKYAAVTSRIPCSNTITVDTATDFNVGDTVLMIQMKGAQIDSTNTASFGNILNYNGAGNYEYNVIKAKAGNTITFKYKIAKFYDIPNGKVQIVRVPYFQKYTVNQPHTCMPWNGSKGGVFVVNVADSLKLNSKIDVSGKGFKGGQINNGTAYSCNYPDYYYPDNTNNGGMKGEGITTISNQKIRGRGKLANGGGGGNSTNAGGAGGSNAGIGGQGGRQWASCDTTVDYGGIGGMALAYANRLFQGGGGGCGHENNGDTDPAGNGGGIVIINTLNFSGNNQLIKANGDNCIDNFSLPPSSGDGQSGGGAGGAILIKATNIASNPSIEAKGGNGGNVYVVDPHGPGGGGGGGAVLFAGTSIPATAINVNGGNNGVITFNSNPHFATSGQTGLITSGYSLTFPAVTDTFKPNQITVNFTDSVVSCYTRKMKDSVSVITSPIYSYYWDFGGGNTSTLKNPTYTFPGYGSFPVKLVVIDSSGCKDSIIKNVIIPYIHFAYAGKDTSVCLGGTTTLSASGGVSYSWSPTTGLGTPNAATTTVTPAAPTSYIVTVTNAQGCVDKDTVNVTITYTHFANAGKDTSTCLGVPVSLTASGGVSYLWSPTAGLGSPNAATTTASINATTDYVVTVTNNQGCIDKDTVRVTLVPSPPLTVSPDTTVCKGATITLHASAGSDFTWTPRYAFTNPDVANPTTVITEPTSFEVTGKAFNGCISSATVYVDTLPGPAITITSDIANLDCHHNSMQLFAGGAVSYQWQPAQYCDNATLASPVVTPPTDMLFTVTGTDINGCSGAASFNVATNFELGVFVPSAFSPNGDLHNDRIRPIVYCDFIFEEFRIFDRFGENVFTSYQIENSWDGYFKGTPVPVGVYFYFVKGKRRNGDDAIIKGDITLIR